MLLFTLWTVVCCGKGNGVCITFSFLLPDSITSQPVKRESLTSISLGLIFDICHTDRISFDSSYYSEKRLEDECLRLNIFKKVKNEYRPHFLKYTILKVRKDNDYVAIFDQLSNNYGVLIGRTIKFDTDNLESGEYEISAVFMLKLPDGKGYYEYQAEKPVYFTVAK